MFSAKTDGVKASPKNATLISQGCELEGELTLWLEDEELRLQAGDGFQIPSHMRSRYANRSQAPVRVLWVYA